MPQTATAEPVATFFHGRYPNLRIITRDEPDAAPSIDVQFRNGQLDVWTTEEAEFVRGRSRENGSEIFEGRAGDGTPCPLCQRRKRVPPILNARALALHMKIEHE